MITTILLVLVIVYLFRNTLSDVSVFNPFAEPEVREEPIVEGKFTPETLQKYNGTDDPKIFIAVKGKVYNVSQGASFYGPGGPYENFAGRDASRGLAKNSFEAELLTPINKPIDTLKDLTDAEIESLDGWEEHFENKYPIVGSLHENGETGETGQ
ncbi:cytochrome b5 [Suhomyces tanzawaensis NRRL Y-17324]|uniref:Cytochrome b5 n=1 Tax=Suhomyces tanzawaensis NRRL Y-17324 TaxID=984487 RepID=A0A1E4SKK7_9ASCO|nr:cytochrome b5 [Suhomyces tanzawaensis NRRL Y-17324]ODV79962.1 cytochrome b5 [Suhomyces tanzawaensis NRRL Y-17324]